MPMQVAELRTLLAGRLESFLDDLRLLTGMDCGTADKAGVDRVGAWVRHRCGANGWHTQVHARAIGGDIVEAHIAGEGRSRILIVTHMDTVYATGTVAARPMRVEGGRILAPGAADMKAGLLAAIYAVEALEALPWRPFGEIVLLFTADEEIGSPESKELIVATAKECDAALVMEPARQSGAIVVARKGITDYRLDVQGVSAHAGVEPEKGRNAILEMAHQIVTLQALNGSVPGGIVNVGKMQGGTALNVVPDAATAGVQVRAPDPEGLARLDELMRGVAASPAVAGTTASLAVLKRVPPMARTAANERLVSLARVVAEELGFGLEAVATGGASDACVVAQTGIPVIDGPGPIGGAAHSPREWLAHDSIVPRTALLAGLIARIAESGEVASGQPGFRP